ncbi:MAG: hypothetical protein SWX82_08650 [Cyanobacteriota bacterium]|nr:hypothetical protein [Cyanobacteriota bacterium]
MPKKTALTLVRTCIHPLGVVSKINDKTIHCIGYEAYHNVLVNFGSLIKAVDYGTGVGIQLIAFVALATLVGMFLKKL